MRRRGAEVDLDKHVPPNIIGVSMARAAACRAAQRLARAQKGGVHSWAPCHAASFISDERRWKRSTTGMRASAHSLKHIPTELDRGSSPLEKATPCTLLSAALAQPKLIPSHHVVQVLEILRLVEEAGVEFLAGQKLGCHELALKESAVRWGHNPLPFLFFFS